MTVRTGDALLCRVEVRRATSDGGAGRGARARMPSWRPHAASPVSPGRADVTCLRCDACRCLRNDCRVAVLHPAVREAGGRWRRACRVP